MNYPGITILGSIVSGETIEKIRSEEIKYQQSADFGFDKTVRLREEIGTSWAAVRAHWTAFKIRRDRLKESDTGASETRASWVMPLMRELGYDLRYNSTAEIAVNGKSYHINHGDAERKEFPVHIVGINQKLDIPTEQGRFSPHSLVQEYLNNTDHLFAIITNGQFLRLLRDANRLIKLAYLEFNLEKILEEELYSDFAILFRLLHASRMPKDRESGEDSYIEYYHQESLASGSRFRDRLSDAMEGSLTDLANGFLSHPENGTLREAVQSGRITPYNYFQYQLRLVYRILFLFVTEERNLVYTTNGKELEQKRKIYLKYYSMERLRHLVLRLNYIDKQKYDLWEGLKSTFRLFEDGFYGQKLGIKPLGHGIFSSDAIGILKDCRLDNETLLKVIKNLTIFENEQKLKVRVNYGDLDVEEFGSVYEGLLEYEASFTLVRGMPIFIFVQGDERSRTGSHYTPEELVKPLIKHSLDYLIEDKLKEKDREEALLSLKICDVACGSGHILLSAARRVATELARVRTGEDQPSPFSFRKAICDVIVNCIYGVDKNPLAVELCKVALWLESHNPGEPLNFLDNHIKCGDSIVGLAHREELENGIASEAYKALPGDDKEVAQALAKQNRKQRAEYEAKTAQLKADFDKSIEEGVQDSMVEYRKFSSLPETTPEEITAKEKAYKKFLAGKGRSFLKAMADLQVAQFFITKTPENKEKLITDADYRQMLGGWLGWQDRRTSYANVIADEKKIFHWCLEFPEVFNHDGFDCILGNPPFLGGLRISTNFGNDYLNLLKTNYPPAGGTCDLVAYFFRRVFNLIKVNSFLSLISTNTISQGDTREGGIEPIIQSNGIINHAVKSMKWPGQANLEVSLVSINKEASCKKYLNGNLVSSINSLLTDDLDIGNPLCLHQNMQKCFAGTTVLGKGFILKSRDAENIVKNEKLYFDVINPYLIGDDLNNSPNQAPSRYVINFFDWNEEKAKLYPLPYNIILENVKPVRLKDNRKAYREKWWLFAERRVELYNKLPDSEVVISVCRVTKFLSFSLVPKGYIYDVGTNVILSNSESLYALLHSNLHEIWARKYGSSLETRLRYTNEDCFENFPFPQNLSKEKEDHLSHIGEQYDHYRRQLTIAMQLGLTKTYNAFHTKEVHGAELTTQGLKDLDKKTIEKKFGKEVWNLWNHLQKTHGTCSFEEAVAGIIKLRELHVEMDNAVLEAYGWGTSTSSVSQTAQQPAVQLRHDFYEVDYLPENDSIRYTIRPDARKEILKRLLELNHKIHEEEVNAGLWEKKGTKEYKQKKKKSSEVNENETGYGGLFDKN
jgi:hypothetical protein